MPWPFRRRNETTAEAAPAAGGVALAEAPAPVEAPAPEPPRYARAAPGAWKKLPPILTVTTEPPRTAVLEEFTASLATRQQIVHLSTVPTRSADAPSGIVHAAPLEVVRRAASPREMPPMDVPLADLPAPGRIARPTNAPRPSWGLDELPPLPPVKLVPLPPPPQEAYDFELDDLGPDGVIESWSIERDAPEEIRKQLGLVEVEPPETPEPTPQVQRRRPNLGQSRRAGLGQPVQLPEDYLQRLRAGQGVPFPRDEAAPELIVPPGVPVPEDLRQLVMDAEGVDVGDVTIIRDSSATAEAQELNALAFVRDGNVYLPPELGPLDHPEIRALAAHELIHLAQQRKLGTGLPEEATDAGQDLEAAARAAEAYVRGDGAPRPGSEEARRHEVVRPLLTGVARLDDAGNLVYAPGHSAARGVQRAPGLDLNKKPDYAWQLQVLEERGVDIQQGSGFLDRLKFSLSSGAEDPAKADEKAAEQLENAHLDTLVGHRMEQLEKKAEEREKTRQEAEWKQYESAARQSGRVPQQKAVPEDQSATEAELAVAEQEFQNELDRLRALQRAQQQAKAIRQVQVDAINFVESAYPLRPLNRQRAVVSHPPEPVIDLEEFARIRERAAHWGAEVSRLKLLKDARNEAELTHRTGGGSGDSGSESDSDEDEVRAHGDKVVEELSADVKKKLEEVDKIVAEPKKAEGKTTAEKAMAAMSGKENTGWQQEIAAQVAAQKAASQRGTGFGARLFGEMTAVDVEDLASMTKEQRDQWEAANIGPLSEKRTEIFNKAADTAAEAIASRMLIEKGQNVFNLSRPEKLSYLTGDDWDVVFKKVRDTVPLMDENRDPLALKIPADALSRRQAMDRGEVEEVPPAAQPAVNPVSTPTTPAPTPATTTAPALAPATSQASVIPSDLKDIEHDQLDILAKRLWFFMRSRVRTELLVDRERAGLLSDFVR